MADEPEPTADEAEQESLSLAERLANAYNDWLHDQRRHQRRWHVAPVEVALLAVIVAVALLVLAGIMNGVAYWSGSGVKDVTALFGVSTTWADLPLAATLLGATLLAQYQCGRICDDFESYATYDDTLGNAPDGAEIDQVISLSKRLRRARLAIVGIAFLGLVTAVAAVANLIWELYFTASSNLSTPWYGYLGEVLARLSAVIPALTCLVIAPRGWGRGSYLLSADEPDAASEDVPDPTGAPAQYRDGLAVGGRMELGRPCPRLG